MSLSAFQHGLHYLHTIGQIVFLQSGLVCPLPALIPKLLSKFISPLEVRNALLSSSSNVQILNEQQIGCILQVGTVHNETYVLIYIYIYILSLLISHITIIKTDYCKKSNYCSSFKYASNWRVKKHNIMNTFSHVLEHKVVLFWRGIRETNFT